MNDFVTLAYILSYPGMFLIIWAGTQFAKNLWDVLKPDNKTRYLVLFFTIILVTFRTILLHGEITFETVLAMFLEWLVNIILLWLSVMKAHELIVEPATKK